MSKLFMCDKCGNSYKNSRSLSTHKYTYHAKKPISLNSPASSTDHDLLHSKFDVSPSRQSHNSLEELEENVSGLIDESRNMKVLLTSLSTSVKELEDLAIIHLNKPETKSGVAKSEIERLEDMIKSNKRDVLELKKKNLNDDGFNSLAGHDFIEDLIEMPTLFANRELNKITADIPTFRLVLKYILTHMDLSEINEAEIRFLNDLSESTKNECKDLIDGKFDELANIFEKLGSEFDDLLESSESNGDVSEDESEEGDDTANDDYSERRPEDSFEQDSDTESGDADKTDDEEVTGSADTDNNGEYDSDSDDDIFSE